MFNRRLFQQTNNRDTIRDFAMKDLETSAPDVTKERTGESAKSPSASASAFDFRTATGRTVKEYMTFYDHEEEEERNGGVYFTLDIITRYTLLITIMNLSVIICAAGWNVMYFTDNLSNPIPLMLPLLIQAFDGALNAFCLLLFYSYGDGCYAKLCLCNKKDSLRF